MGTSVCRVCTLQHVSFQHGLHISCLAKAFLNSRNALTNCYPDAKHELLSEHKIQKNNMKLFSSGRKPELYNWMWFYSMNFNLIYRFLFFENDSIIYCSFIFFFHNTISNLTLPRSKPICSTHLDDSKHKKINNQQCTLLMCSYD